MFSLSTVPAIPLSRIARVAWSWIFAVAQVGISEVLVNLAPLTAAVPNNSKLTARVRADVFLSIDWVVTDFERRVIITHSHPSSNSSVCLVEELNITEYELK